MSTGNGLHAGSNGHGAGVPAPATATVGAASDTDTDTDTEPEAAPLVLAALWRRVLARTLDWFAMFWVLFALQVMGVSFWVRDYTDEITPAPWGNWFMVLTTIAGLYAILEIVYLAKRGQTPAKELLKIRVAHPGRDDRSLGWGLALARWVVPGLAMALPLAIGPVVLAVLGLPAAFDPKRRTLWDRLAGTVVVPYDAKVVEGPIRNRRAIVRSVMDRQIAAIAGRPDLMEDDDDPHPRHGGPRR